MLKWVKPLKTTKNIYIIIVVILVQTNIYCRHSAAATYFILYYIHSTVVKVLCYKSEGRWFDPSWCQWIFY